MIILPNNWSDYEGRLVRFPHNFTVPAAQAIVMLHGANLNSIEGAAETHAQHIEDTGQELLTYADQTNTILVLPSSGVISPQEVTQQNWDWTGHFDYGRDVTYIIETIRRIQVLGTIPVFLHGGSAGGVMAWKVANELERMGQIDMIRGLICTECISPFSTSVTATVPPAYRKLDASKEFSFGGIDFYDYPDVEAQLGLPNYYTNWAKQMLYQYSPNDPIVLSEWKEDFAEALDEKATALTVKISGTGHDLGPAGWSDLVTWLQEVAV